MSDLYTVSQQLEALNENFAEVRVATNAQNGLLRQFIQQGQRGGGGASEESQGRIAKVLKGSGNILTRLIVQGFASVQQAAMTFERLQLESISGGIKSVDLLDNLLKENRKVRGDADQANNLLARSFAGVEAETRATADAARVGLQLSKTEGDRATDRNHLLRNQIGILDSQGNQGKVVLSYFQDLIRRGYSEEEARRNTQSFADVALYSLQTAQNTKRFVDQFDEIESLQNLFGGGAGSLGVALQALVPDVEADKETAKFLKNVFLPTSDVSQFVSRAMPQEFKALRAEFRSIGDRLGEEGVSAAERERLEAQLRETTREFATDVIEEIKRESPFEGLVGADGDLKDLGLLFSKSTWFNELKDFMREAQSARATIGQQERMEVEGPPRREFGDLKGVTDELIETFEFADRALQDLILSTGDLGRDLRRVSIAALEFAGTTAASLTVSGIEEADDFFSNRQGLDQLRGSIDELNETLEEAIRGNLITGEGGVADLPGVNQAIVTLARTLSNSITDKLSERIEQLPEEVE